MLPSLVSVALTIRKGMTEFLHTFCVAFPRCHRLPPLCLPLPPSC